MKILLISPYFHPHRGGSQQYAEELYFHLMKKNPSIRVDVICYNTDNAPAKESYRGFTIYRVPCIQILPGQFALPNYLKLWQLLRQLKKRNHYRFINSHTRFFENSWWTPLVAKWFKSTSILTDHCATHPVHNSGLVRAITRAVDRFLVPFIADKYDIVTVTSKATHDFIKSLGVRNPVIVYGGVDTQSFRSSKKSLQRKPITVSFVGRMIPSKGPHILVEVAKDMIKKNKNVRFIFAGDGEMNKQLSKLSSKNISFVGTLNKTEVAELMKKTDILVHPSLHHEGFPNVLLEAGASGCAIIATDRGGTKEIIIDGKTGLIVEPSKQALSKALNTLIENKAERQKLGSALQKHVQKQFDWNKIAGQFAQVI